MRHPGLTIAAVLVSTLVMRAEASAASCADSVLKQMQHSPQFSQSVLRVTGSATIKAGQTYFIETEDYVNDLGQDVEQININEYTMAVLMKKYAVLADPKTCRPLRSRSQEPGGED